MGMPEEPEVLAQKRSWLAAVEDTKRSGWSRISSLDTVGIAAQTSGRSTEAGSTPAFARASR
jgi:hypothetical protein